MSAHSERNWKRTPSVADALRYHTNNWLVDMCNCMRPEPKRIQCYVNQAIRGV